ncbi:invasin domain 3-containing protein, partial [Isoptericola sp. NPDC019693]|uniref:invasin domain 3-containing protein n=1 Tax=Isoptericola sp. NPDC019693 TaxID=3364009 RepID=UPI00378AB282
MSHQGDDANPGDGVCATADGLCTLRAALQEANALPLEDEIVIAPAEDVDASTAGVQSSGTIVGTGSGTANFMYSGNLTPEGDTGAYFMATRPVTIDFQNRLGIASLNDAYGATALYINGPGVTLRNFSSIKSNETAVVFGPESDGSTVENGTCTDPSSINLERCFWLADGANQITIRNVEMGSTYAGAVGAIGVAANATIDDLTLDRIRMYDPDTEYYDGFAMYGNATLNRLTVTGSTFEGFRSGRYALDLRGAVLTDARITGNSFLRNSSGGAAPITVNRAGSGNVIADNTFDNTGGSASYAVQFTGLGLAATADSGWTVRDNYFDAFTSTSVRLEAGSGILPVEQNTFGPKSYGDANAAAETGGAALVYNATATANQNITTWYPTAVTTDPGTCTLDVDVTPPTTGVTPSTPVTIDVFYTPTTKAEIYLGRQTGLTEAGTVTVPYTLGEGNIRVQTTAASGATSQYSRTVAQTSPDSCGPAITVEQASSQADPTSVRDIRFTVTLSETVSAELEASAFSTEGSTAPGVTVTKVTRTSGSSFEVVARADGSGTVQLSLPEGAIADDVGNPSQASTSTDNEVEYVSPLSVSPAEVEVNEDGTTATYTVASSLAATSPLTITPTVADPAWASVSPSPLTIDTIASSGTVTVSAVDNTVVDGTRSTSVSHAVASSDANFDGLLLDDVAVTVLDDDTPVASTSGLTLTSGTRTADGDSTHTASAVVRNAAGTPVSGVLVTFRASGDADLSATSCTTGADGSCAVDVTSTVAGTYDVQAFLDGTAEIGGSPAQAAFVAGPADLTTSTIGASALSVPADGSSTTTITVRLLDAQGNPLTASGGTVTLGATEGTLGAVEDHGDGTYTATLTAPTTTGTATVTYALDGVAGERSVVISFVAGDPSPSTSQIEADPAEVVVGTGTSTVTVTLLDGYGNAVTTGGHDVAVETSAGTLGEVTDNGDGTYTATLTASDTAQVATLEFLVGEDRATATATVAFVPGETDLDESTITAAPSSLTADGVSQSEVRVTLLDALGNVVGAGGADVVVATDRGSVGDVVDNGDGTYTAILTAPTSPGTATLTATVDGAALTATATVTFLAGSPDAAASSIAASPTTITADGESRSTVTVTVRDAQSTVLVDGGADVALSTDAGALSDVVDNEDGTYSATLTSATTVGTATVGFTVNGVQGAGRATVAFVAGAADPASATITAEPPTVTADGTATSTLTVTLVDAHGNRVTTGGTAVTMASTLGSLGSVIDNGDGTSTAFLSSEVAGDATVSFTVAGVDADATADVEFVAGAADAATSTIEADPATITADGTSESTVTVTLHDAQGNPLTASGGEVTMTADAGELSVVTDESDGTYTATLASSTEVETATVTFALDGVAGEDSAEVAFVAGEASASTSTIEADPASITADGDATSTVTVTLLDAQGNPVGASGGDVTMATTAGELGAVTDHLDGTYTATLTSSKTAGTATVSFALDDEDADATAEVTFTAGVASTATSTIEADPTTITADGASTSIVTVTLQDAYGNPLTASGGTVTMATDAGSLDEVTDNQDGTYTAELTSSTTAGTATLTFAVDGAEADKSASVAFVAGAADAARSTIAADPTQLTADGTSTSTVTVTLLDAQGNAVGASGGDVTMATTAGGLGAVTDHEDGTYTATLTAPSSTTPPAATLTFALDGEDGTATATVAFVAGVPSTTTSTIEADPASITADGSSESTVTVTLRDGNGNLVTDAGDVVTVSTDAGRLSEVTDEGDGTYTATLTSATAAGTATVGFAVDGAGASATAHVAFVAGSADAGSSTIAASPTSVTADGTSTSAITVRLVDAHGNPLTSSGGRVALATTTGALSPVTDNEDGTYTATLTAPQAVGTATVSFTVDGEDATAKAEVAFVAGEADASTSTIAAAPETITADGLSTSTVTVTLRDAHGNLVTGAGDVVELATTAGSLGAVADNEDGTYTATLTAPQAVGTATVSFTVDGEDATAKAEVAFV